MPHNQFVKKGKKKKRKKKRGGQESWRRWAFAQTHVEVIQGKGKLDLCHFGIRQDYMQVMKTLTRYLPSYWCNFFSVVYKKGGSFTNWIVNFIYENSLQKLSDTKASGSVFWAIASDLDNVPKLQIEKDNQHVIDKKDMTVLLTCCGISGNRHVEFRQARGTHLFTVA